MKQICKPSRFPLILLAVAAIILLAACAPAQTPTAAPTEKVPQCSVTVVSGQGWNSIIGLLGIDPVKTPSPDLVVDGYETKPFGAPQPGMVVSRPSKPGSCTGEYIAARHQEFSAAELASVNGFGVYIDRFDPEQPLTAQGYFEGNTLVKGIQEKMHDVCDKAARANGYQIAQISDGCSYTTVTRYALTSGTVICRVYSTVPEANKAMATSDLTKIKALAIAIAQVTPTEAQASLCK